MQSMALSSCLFEDFRVICVWVFLFVSGVWHTNSISHFGAIMVTSTINKINNDRGILLGRSSLICALNIECNRTRPMLDYRLSSY